MENKIFVGPKEYFQDSYKLANQIIDSGYKPNYTIALWRGGTIPGCVVQEVLVYNQIKNDHIAIRTSAYNSDNSELKKEIRVHGLGYIIDRVTDEDRLLIVDDVFDKGVTIDTVIKLIKQRARKNTPGQIKVATVYFKPKMNKTNRIPDYYIHETDKKIIFPHEFVGLSLEEIAKEKRDVIGNDQKYSS